MDKLLLKNTLKHVTIHNKLKEEEVCWKEYSSIKKKKKKPKQVRKSRTLEENQLIEQNLSRQLNRTLKKAEYIEKRLEKQNTQPMIGSSNMTALDFWRSLAENERLSNMVEDKWKHDGFESYFDEVKPLESSFRPVSRKVLKTDSDSVSSDASDRKPKKAKKVSKKSKKKRKSSRRRTPTPSPSEDGDSDEEFEWVPSNNLAPKEVQPENKQEAFSVELPPQVQSKLEEEDTQAESQPKTQPNEIFDSIIMKPNYDEADMDQSPYNIEEEVLITRVEGNMSPIECKSDCDGQVQEEKIPPRELKPEDFAGKKIEIKTQRMLKKEVPKVFAETNSQSNSDYSSENEYSDEENRANGWSKPHSKIYVPKKNSGKKRKLKSKKKKSKKSKRSSSVSSRSSASEEILTSDPEYMKEKSEIRKKKAYQSFQTRQINTDFWGHDGWNEMVKENPDDAKFKKKIDKAEKKKRKKEAKKEKKRAKKLEKKRKKKSKTKNRSRSSSESSAASHSREGSEESENSSS